MSLLVRISALPAALVLIATGAWHVPAQAAEECSGQSAPQVTTPGNTAPTTTNDTSNALAGGTRTINVLGNDADAEGNDLYVVSVSQPGKGEVCVNSNGTLLYFGVSSDNGYTDTFSYGVTDGDLYRTGSVTVTVQGIKVLRGRLVKRLKKRKKARVWFTNPNNRTMLVIAGTPKKPRPLLTRSIAPGGTVKMRSKYKRIVWYALATDLDGQSIFVNLGILNTRNGRQSIARPESLIFRASPRLRTLKRQWASGVS